MKLKNVAHSFVNYVQTKSFQNPCAEDSKLNKMIKDILNLQIGKDEVRVYV